MSKTMVCLMGPTASGKTAIACEWVQQFPFEIISVDSAMIYQGMDIGTAKPDRAVLQAAPHHLIDICTPVARYSAAAFCEEVWTIRDAIVQRGNIPLLVGGTMMYFRALQQGLSPLPEADDALRAELVAQQALHGSEFMHAWLHRVDPASALRIHAKDTQRLQRALEVFLLTNTPLSEYLASKTSLPEARFINISLFPNNRAWLHERIARRFALMLNEGFMDEVSHLVQQWDLTLAHPSMRSVGYRQALQYLQGEMDYASFCERAVAATRQVAKRQLTWLRSWPDAIVYDPEDSKCMTHLLAHARQIVDNE
jgi:tRNA dimethylallyltransferase